MRHLEKLGKKKLGEILVAEGIVPKENIDTALAEQEKSGGFLGEVLLSMNVVTEVEIAKALAKQFQLPFIFPTRYAITDEVRDTLPPGFIRRHRIVPLDIFGKVLSIAVSEVPDIEVIVRIKQETGLDVFLYIATVKEVESVLDSLVPEEKKEPQESGETDAEGNALPEGSGEDGEGGEWESIFDIANEAVIQEMDDVGGMDEDR